MKKPKTKKNKDNKIFALLFRIPKLYVCMYVCMYVFINLCDSVRAQNGRGGDVNTTRQIFCYNIYKRLETPRESK